jgi:hypothetical protein
VCDRKVVVRWLSFFGAEILAYVIKLGTEATPPMPDSLRELESGVPNSSNGSPVWAISAAVPFPLRRSLNRCPHLPPKQKVEREIAEFRRFEDDSRVHCNQSEDLSESIRGRPAGGIAGKKTTAAACENAAAQLEQQFQRIFHDRRQSGQLDLEAVETAIRSTVLQSGADAVTELLRCQPPDDGQRGIPCSCGQTARYEGVRSRPILTVVGWARIERPHYLCASCNTGQFPADVQLDIDKTDFSPVVRRNRRPAIASHCGKRSPPPESRLDDVGAAQGAAVRATCEPSAFPPSPLAGWRVVTALKLR